MTTHAFRTGLLASIAVLGLAACSTAPVQKGEPIEPAFPADRVLEKDVTYAGDIYDPWEGFNRTMYRFNYRFDKYVFLPVVNAYQTVTPDVAEQGVHNFFNNLKDITTLFNSMLQLEGEKTLDTTVRVVWNTTAGLLGFIDVATVMELPRHEEDFGQTLGYWGVGPGPYLVLPILGPSSARDGIGLGVDWVANRVVWNKATDLETWQDWAVTVLKAIDTRAHIGFRYYETGSPFEYFDVRLLYSTKRKMDIEK